VSPIKDQMKANLVRILQVPQKCPNSSKSALIRSPTNTCVLQTTDSQVNIKARTHEKVRHPRRERRDSNEAQDRLVMCSGA